jgi:GTP cyclohydrolase I
MVKPSKPAQKPLVSIADVQGLEDTRRIDIDKVGIKGIRHPVRVKDRTGGEQHTIATFDMAVCLPHNFKGTHMSRFVEILNRREQEITVESFKEMLPEMTGRNAKFTAMVDVFNAMNSGTVTMFATTTGPTFKSVIGILDPRIVRFGARFDF